MPVRESIARALQLLDPRDRRLLWLAVAVQMISSTLDLVGVLLLGLVASLAVTTVQSQPPPPLVANAISTLGLEDLTDQQIVVLLAAIAAVTLLFKSIVSSILNRRVFIFLANRQALVTARLTKELLLRSLIFLQRRTSQETAYALIQGTAAATVQMLGQMVVAMTELALLAVLGVALLFLNPAITLGAIAFFACVAVALQWAMGRWASRLGSAAAEAEIASLNAIQEALAVYREISVSDRRELYVQRIQDLRWLSARVSADASFIGMVPKYIFEAALVVGGFVLAGILFATEESVQAIGTLALFIAASSRIMPSLLRLQGASLSLRGAAGSASTAFELAKDLGNPSGEATVSTSQAGVSTTIRMRYPDFHSSVDLQDVSFTYPGADAPAVSEVSISAPPGSSIAMVGRSGSGKSTLADIILGILQPDHGTARIGGVPPAEAVRKWPGGIAYVPQDVTLASASIRSNVALGLADEHIDDDLVREALRRAHLLDYLEAEREGIQTYVGEGGVRLSGGQRQRLGIARALFSRPRLLLLDEATSALDAETEVAITETLRELEGDVTLVVIAHRLSTVKAVDCLYFLERGHVVAKGTFDEVRDEVPALSKQAKLMGL